MTESLGDNWPGDPRAAEAIPSARDCYHRFLRQGELRMERCDSCGYIRLPGRSICPECLNGASSWHLLSGEGSVQCFVWYMKDLLDTRYVTTWAYTNVPYNVALVRLREGPTVITNVVDVTHASLSYGMTVQARFVPVSEKYAILRFRPDSINAIRNESANQAKVFTGLTINAVTDETKQRKNP